MKKFSLRASLKSDRIVKWFEWGKKCLKKSVLPLAQQTAFNSKYIAIKLPTLGYKLNITLLDYEGENS